MRLPAWVGRRRLARLSAVALAVLVVGYLDTNQRDLEESQRRLDRQAERLAEQQTALEAQQAQLARSAAAQCVVFAGIGHPELLRPESSQLARDIVGNSATAAQIMGCAPDPGPG